MSQENVDLAHRAYEAFNARDRDAFLALMADEVTAESRLAALEGSYRGHAGVVRWWDGLLDVFPDYTIRVDAVADLGDVTLARLRAAGHGADSRTPLMDPVWHPGRWRNGQCVWWRVCMTEREAHDAIARTR